MDWITPDVADERGDAVDSCALPFRLFGRRGSFTGPIRTVRCHEDNLLVRETLNSPGDGAVLVVDGGGSIRRALLGDLIAAAAVENGWAGVIVHGAIRDSVLIGGMDIGVAALATNPKPPVKLGAGDVDAPVTFGGVTFAPGRTVWCDADGVLVEL